VTRSKMTKRLVGFGDAGRFPGRKALLSGRSDPGEVSGMASVRPGIAPTMHNRLLEELGLAITDGRLPPGTVLRIEEVERRYVASRTVVRESIRVLESMQLVTSRRRVGITVQRREHWNVFDPRVIRWRLAGSGRLEQLRSLTELRRTIEPAAARSAALHADRGQRARLLALASELLRTGRAGDLLAFVAYDIAFHRLVLTASHNEMFAALGGVVESVLTGRAIYALHPKRPRTAALEWHSQVAAAIRARDPVRAETAMHEITDEVGGQIERLMARDQRRHAAAPGDRSPSWVTTRRR
jgi:DNA-binding FadR family transcriptional regulator